jgi:hypothetical protein
MLRDEFKTRLLKCSPADLVELIELSDNTTHSARARERNDQKNRDFLLRGVYDNADCAHGVKMKTVDRLRQLTVR